MRKILTILSIFLTMICGSVFLVSCSKGYDKMYLVVEYAHIDGDEVEWREIGANTNIDYVLSQEAYSESDQAHLLYLRVKVKGTSKKVSSLYISQSVNNSMFLESNNIKPNEAFKVLVKNIGSVRFTVTPSQGGVDKSISFGVNVYRELTSISQNPNCIPALVTGGYVKLEDLTNLIQYAPIGETNQTGVDFKIEAVGYLIDDGINNLLGREFVANDEFVAEDAEDEDIISNFVSGDSSVYLTTSQGYLALHTSVGYELTTRNNVIKLSATSQHHNDPDDSISTSVYVYIVENPNANSLLVSYKDDIELDNGRIPTTDNGKIDDIITIYNSTINDDIVDNEYNAVKIYTYTSPSIYSYETNPGKRLSVFVNGVKYDYYDVVNNNFGIQISPINKDGKLVGLKFAVNPNSTSTTNVYNIRLELDFNAFDFSASDKKPLDILCKDFVIKVESLASGFHINGKGYQDNLSTLDGTITGYNSTKLARLYTHYSDEVIGMPLNIQATPTNAINTKVLVGFYDNCSITGDYKLNLGNNLITSSTNQIQLFESFDFSLSPVAYEGYGAQYEINFANKNKLTYLRFNELTTINVKEIYMVCRVECTPSTFEGQAVESKYITFVAKINVVGSVESIYVYKNNNDEVEEHTLTDTYLSANQINTAYINLNSNVSDIDLTDIEIKSAKNNIEFSADRENWSKNITIDRLSDANKGYKVVYFRVNKQCVDNLVIWSSNGVNVDLEYQFVNVVSTMADVKLDYDKTYIQEFFKDGDKTVETVDIKDITTDGAVELRYLALQSSRSAQFRAYGDGQTNTIKSINAKTLLITSGEYSNIINTNGDSVYNKTIPTFSASAIRVSNGGGHLFDISANSVGFTSILLVKVDFYINDGDSIKLQSKYFIYEVAVYTPARDLAITTDKDSIAYINQNYQDVAKVNFEIGLNTATKTLAFSNELINEQINKEYVEGKKSIYGISIKPSESVGGLDDDLSNEYFKVLGVEQDQDSGVYYVDISSRKFSIQALKSLYPLQQGDKAINSISFDIVVYQFGQEKSTTKITKVIYLVSYNKAESIIIASGVESYSNIYLSLLDAVDGKISHNIEAYTSNSQDNVTYGELGYKIYRLNTDNERLTYTGADLSVVVAGENEFTITAQNAGGVYLLELYSKDSYNAELGDYEVKKEIKITVSDGATEQTAYLIEDLNDFANLKTNTENKFYKLWQDIDLSALESTGWWDDARTFEGQLDGAITIEDPNTGSKIYRCYSLRNLTISAHNNLSNDSCFGLFSSNLGTIKNVIFDNVTINITLIGGEEEGRNTSTSGSANIGVITAINDGNIENCSVNIASSLIKFDSSASNTIYNIGLIAGLNNKTISYQNTATGSNFSHIVDCVSGGKLNIEVINGIYNKSSLGANTDINIGGVAGKNSAGAKISADYVDKSSKSVRELIGAVVNIEFVATYDTTVTPIDINTIAIGGIVGANIGEISNIAVSGSIVAKDRADIGGIAGINTGKVKESANYGTYIQGGVYIEDYVSSNSKTIVYHGLADNNISQEQNIGGIVGFNNAGIVDNIRVIFITFNKDEVSVEAGRAQISGVGNVGGIVGKAINTQLMRGYVENFVEDGENELNYNIIGSGANVAGLIADSTSSSVSLSFVQADFNVEGCAFHEFGKDLTYNYTYFIGDVLSDDVNKNADNIPTSLKNHNTANIGISYIIDNLVYIDVSGKTVKNIVKYGLDNIVLNTNHTTTDDYIIQWRKSEDEGVNGKQPYLVYFVESVDGEYEFDGKKYVLVYTLTIEPTDIIVNVDEKYFDEDAIDKTNSAFIKYDGGLYVQYIDDNNTPDESSDDLVVSTAIVYYVEGANNTHKLVSDNKSKGLIEKAVLPNLSGVDGSYAVSILSGSSIATLTDGGKTITFNGVGKVELKFVSLFNRNITDIVTIFVENPLHDDVFNINAGSGLADRSQSGNRFTTMVGVNSLLGLSLKQVEGQTFDSDKTYMTRTVGSATAYYLNTESGKIETIEINPTNNAFDFFEINAITEELVENSNKYVLGQFEVVSTTLDKSYSYVEIPVTIDVYLNLASFYIDGVALSELMGETSSLIKSKTITIVIYNKATGLTVSSNVKAEAGVGVDIDAKLTTGYVNTSNSASSSVSYDIVGAQGNKLTLNILGQDKVDILLTAINSNAQQLIDLAKQNATNPGEYIDELFTIVVTYVRDAGNLGYTYNINLRLNEKYRYLNLSSVEEDEWKFNLNITANSNQDLSKNVQVAFVPQQLINFRLENYSNLVTKVGQSGEAIAEYVSNQAESSLIIPGESGLIKIFAEYSYSYFENISITSSRQIVDGKEYFVRYQQMVYDKTNNVYKSYQGITADGETLRLNKVSYIENGRYSYDGVIFVRTILDDIVGVRKVFDLTVNATTYDLDGNEVSISRTKTVISQYRPGVYISVTDALISERKFEEEFKEVSKKVYLVEENSSITTIVARVYGYEFNVQPLINISAINESDTIDGSEVALTQQGNVVQDETGAYVIEYSLAVYTSKPFKVSMNMTLIDNGNTLTSRSEELIFYPVPYIISDVYLKGEANNGLTIPVNTSKNLELVWNTKNSTNSKVDNINANVNQLNILELFYVYTSQDHKKLFSEYLNKTDSAFSIKQSGELYRIESLMKVSPIRVYFDLWYGYDLSGETAVVNFGKVKDESTNCIYKISHEFTLNLTIKTTEDAPNPINTAEEFIAMAEGENYILMKDITLENWAPLDTAIASLDGNGKVINIKSFNIAVGSALNVGLFATVSQNTILKNIVVNIGTMQNNLGTNATALYINDDNIVTSIINFGLLAGVNNGLIYNCEVLSINTTRTLELVVGAGYNLIYGGLVGVNNGNITNSRVGTEYFEQLTESDGLVLSSVVQCESLYLKSKGIVAGFVGENSVNSVISSCYVANTSVENTSNIGDSKRNRTAGFVATNAGTIAYSYVKGLERNILISKSTTAKTTPNGVECVIYASGAGSVAGFAYYNSGTIHDCYTNTVCVANSSGVAGFVYDTSSDSSAVYQCYSASKVDYLKDNGENGTPTALATELPFVGVGIDKDNAQQLLSNKNMINCYYLIDGTEYDENYELPLGVAKPEGLSLESFASSGNLNNFSFINSSSTEQQLNAVWTYSTGMDKNKTTYSLGYTNLPELTGANSISRSIRVYADTQSGDSETKNYKYPTGYEQGSKINPYIIRNVDEYRSVFIDGASSSGVKKYISGYVRFIDNISFVSEDEYINIDTRSKYMLGDQNNNTFTLIDGNGMTISDVVINYTEDETGNLGLFSEVYNTVIKGLNIKYASQTNDEGNEVGSSTANYVGGVAGIANNTYFIDLTLSGSVTLRAHNVVGGVVGRLTGLNSGIFNVETSLNVQAGNYNNSNLYNGENSETMYLSYAGGIAGIIDIGSDYADDYNLNKLSVNASNVRANRAGGIAGYFGGNVNAKRLTYTISTTSQIFGREVAGGVVADNFADIELSQVNGDDNQYDYDKAFGRYINNNTLNRIDNINNAYGNLSAITGEKIAGGFIGVNYGGDVTNSLTKANIGHNSAYGIVDTVGGFIGLSYGGDLVCVYAQNYIDLIYNTQDAEGQPLVYRTSKAGGLIGEVAYSNSIADSDYIGLDNVVTSNWFDKQQVENLTAGQTVDYLIAKCNAGVSIKKNKYDDVAIVNYGTYNTEALNSGVYLGGKIKNNNVKDAEYFDMEALYYVSTGESGETQVSTQQDIFDKLFAVWSYMYWDKDYTKFMPSLKLDDATDYIEIDEEGDLKQIAQFPDRNFILVKSISVSSNSNYIVNTNFKGVLIGTIEEANDGEKTYTKFTINLNASTSNDSGAGFFKQTTGARIANIGFEYESLNLSGSGEYKTVGGVSALDSDSHFENVIVSQTGSQPDLCAVKTSNSNVTILGSIVGEGARTTIISCESDLSYDVSANKVATNNNHAYIGGLVGSLNGKNDEFVDGVAQIRYDGLITSSVYSGSMVISSDEGVNVGGLVADAKYTRISDCRVQQFVSDQGTPDDVSDNIINDVIIKIESAGTNYIGGVVAVYDMCSISDCSSRITITDKDIATPTPIVNTDTTYYAGGLVGEIRNQAQIDTSIENSYSLLTYDVIKTDNAYVGGVVANQASNTDIELDTVLSQVNIQRKADNGGGMISDEKLINKLTVGGIIGLVSGNVVGGHSTTIVNSMSIMYCDVEYSSTLFGGGIIGQATGSYSISGSTSMGNIFANNASGTHIVPETYSSLTVLGGLVGFASSETKDLVFDQQITNSYTALTLSTANVYGGTIVVDEPTNTKTHEIYTHSIVGKTADGNKIMGEGVVYSSDYTLAFDQEQSTDIDVDKFENAPINVTANMLVFNNNNVKDEIYSHIGNGWIWINKHLPMPKAVQDILIETAILKYKDGSTELEFVSEAGKVYSPIIIGDQNDYNSTNFATENYNYYLLNTDITIAETKNLNGVLLGNNNVITSTKAMFDNVDLHSAVTNLTFELQDDFDDISTIARINNGTIFMCGVKYDEINVIDRFGAIASVNNGLISNCYNSGNAEGNGQTGGLAWKNTANARIQDSYFTGSFSGGETGSALVTINEGFIKNSYSGGMAKTLIEKLEESGRYENVYYDYYANFTSTEGYGTFKKYGIIGKSTREIQAYDTANKQNSNLLYGWKVYSIYNWNDSNITTYNYGYPIHNFIQTTLREGNIGPIYNHVKQTGDGTFTRIEGANTNAITDIVSANNMKKGQLVRDEDNGEYYDNFPFLINNLGVLDLINTLDGESGKPTTAGRYFELEVDIVMPENMFDIYEKDRQLLSNWKGLGTETAPFEGVFTTTSLDYTTEGDVRVYILDKTLQNENIDENNINFNNPANLVVNETPKTISNLTGGALFNYVENGAVIYNIVLADSKVRIAPLVDNVGVEGVSDNSFAPAIYNVKIENVTTHTGGGVISGLVGTVEAENQLNIYNIANGDDFTILATNDNGDTQKHASKVVGVVNENSGTINIKQIEMAINVESANTYTFAGFVLENAGTINIVDASSMSINLNIEDKLTNISGFALNNSGTIVSYNENSKIEFGTIGKASGYMAGLVGTMTGGLVAGFDIEFTQSDASDYSSTVFGGVVAYLEAGQIGQNSLEGSTETVDRTVLVTLTVYTTKTFGAIVAIVGSDEKINDTGSISNVIIETGEQLMVDAGESGDAYGLVVGKYLKNLNEINYTIEDEISFKVKGGKNVGAIIGYATNGTFNFTNDKQSIVNVFGKENVGGFIGRYNGEASLVMQGELWPIDLSSTGEATDEGYARVEIAFPDKPTSNVVSTETSLNFGGLIGYWESSAELSATKVEDEETSPCKIVNLNPVLTFLDGELVNSVEYKWCTNTTKKVSGSSGAYDYIVQNIGGVVGKSNANILHAKNEAVIGVAIDLGSEKANAVAGTKSHQTLNPIYGTNIDNIDDKAPIDDIMQFIYVGGVVGYISTNTSDVTSLMVTDCKNSATIFGMYAVGGLIGGSDKVVEIGESVIPLFEDDDTLADAIVVGLTEVGGLIGRATNLVINCQQTETPVDPNKSDKENITLGKVMGIVNVGGIVGYAREVSISNVVINATDSIVNGNINVGGMVGYSTLAKIENSKILKLQVNGSVFDYKYEKPTDKLVAGESKHEGYYYLPTNIGGVVGYVSSGSTFNSVTTNATVTTDEKFVTHYDEKDTERLCAVNMNKNSIGSTDKANYTKGYHTNGHAVSEYLENFYPSQKVSYYSVDGGIGGFAGKIDEDVVFGIDAERCYVGGDVYASYGINVGGIVGYLSTHYDMTLPTIADPDTTDEYEGIYVAGKIFVGGYIGKSSGRSGNNEEQPFFNQNRVSTINVQKYKNTDSQGNVTGTSIMSGNCIGGVIGYVKGNANNIKLTGNSADLVRSDDSSRIKVFNSNNSTMDSCYVGALIGRIDGNMTGCELAPELCDAFEDRPYYDILDDYDEIHGIIQSPKVYNYGGLVGLADVPAGRKGDNKLQILGTHYYPFTVDGVQNRDYEQGASSYTLNDDVLSANAHYINTSDIEISATALTGLYNNDGNNHNPTNEDARGWAMEYTMFRTFARVIDQNDADSGDSVQVIYNANYITEVHTTFTSSTAEEPRVLSDEIIYTVYQPVGQDAYLYCKYGIAILAEEFEPGKSINMTSNILGSLDSKDLSFEKNYNVTIENGVWKNGDNSGRAAFWGHITDIGRIGEGYLNDKDLLKNGLKDEFKELSEKHKLTFGYTYFTSSNYLGSGEKHFTFEKVFGTYDTSADWSEDEAFYSNSGSIFEVSGITIFPEIGKIKDTEAWVGPVLGGLAIIGAIVAMCIPGVREAIIGALIVGKMTVAAMVWNVALAFVIYPSVALSLAGGAISLFVGAYNIGTYQATSNYNQLENVSMGYMSSVYSRQVAWRDGEMDAYYDALLVIPVEAHIETMEKPAVSTDGYVNLLIKQLQFDAENKICKLPLTYFCCGTYRATPDDLNSKTIINVAELDNADIKTAFKAIGITSLSVPKYYQVDNEIYCYGGSEYKRELNHNYKGVQANLENYSINKNHLIDINGYAYLLDDPMYSDYVVPEVDRDHIKETYNIDPVYIRAIPHSLTKTNGPDITRELDANDKAKLKWRETSAEVSDDKFITQRSVYYAGLTAPVSGGYITKSISRIESGKVYCKVGTDFVEIVELAENKDVNVGDILYFTKTLNGGTSINVTLQPYNYGSGGFSCSEMGYSESTMYFIPDSTSGGINIECTFILSTLTNETYDSDGETLYTIKLLEGDAMDANLSYRFPIYKIDKELDVDSFSDLITEEANVNYKELLAGWDTYKDYSLSNEYYLPVSSMYGVDENGQLYYKDKNNSLLIETSEDSGRQYYYRPIFSAEHGEMVYSNKYIYNQSVNDIDKNVEFYTRFYYGSDFLGKEIGDKTISKMMLPTSLDVENKDIIFAESARISLSVGDKQIYTDYASGDPLDIKGGTIKCIVPKK